MLLELCVVLGTAIGMAHRFQAGIDHHEWEPSWARVKEVRDP